MQGRLRLLQRLASLEFPPACLALAGGNISASWNVLALFPPPATLLRGRGGGCPLLSHYLKNSRQRCFCTRATETEEGSNASLSSPYLSVRIRCSKDVAVVFSEALLCFGANSTSTDEESSCDNFDETWITSIFADDQDVHTCISRAANSIGLNCTPNYEVSMGEQCDWVTNVQETFHPIEVTDGFWIVPNWKMPPNLQATNIMLDPGMAFGTGEHPTTKMCLLLLHGLVKGGENFLDYGTGSGVLAIAAVKLGAALSVGIDIDPQAVTSARQNIVLNEIESNNILVYLVPRKVFSIPSGGRTHIHPEEQTSSDMELNSATEKFDIVIANLLLNPLVELAENIVAFGKPGAVIGLSGILLEQVVQIEKLYSQFLDNISISEMDGWACLHGTRKRK